MRPALASALLSVYGLLAAWIGWTVLAHAIPADPAAALPARLATACAALLPSAGMLAAMVAAQMAGRALSGAIDPTAGRDSRFLQVNQRVITNTVEQLAIFGPALVALAARASGERMPQIVALALVFALTRLVFWLGYLRHPVLRAAGMAPGFAIGIVTLAAAAVAWTR